MPGDAPLVFAPAASAFLAAIADDGVPVSIGLVLIVGRDLEREGFVMFERWTAVETDTGTPATVNSTISTSPAVPDGLVTGCTVYGAHYAVGKRLGVEEGSSLGVLVVP